MSQHFLLNGATEVGAGIPLTNRPSKKTVQAKVTGDGAVTAEIDIEGSVNGVDYETLATISLDDTDEAHDGVALDAPWTYIRANLTAITGTGAAVTVQMSN